MPKTISEKPVFIQNVEDFQNTSIVLHPKQYVQFACINCNQLAQVRVWRFKKNNYRLFCTKCLFHDSISKRSVEKRNSILEKRKQTCLERFGVESATQSKEIQLKIKNHMLQTYGVEYTGQIKASREKFKQTIKNKSIEEKQNTINKRKQTCLKNHGVDSFSKTKVFKEKVIKTCLKKYGVPSSFQWKGQKEKSKQTWLKKYGVENPTYIPNHEEKRRRTCLEKYGVENSAQSQIVKEKFKQTCLEKYGITHIPSYKYIHENISFDSSWELAVWIWATETGKQIKREPIGLEYEFEGKAHTYHPDFEIDGQLIEVKGPHFFNKKGEMQNPYDHSQDALFEAKHQCGLQYNVRFWGKKEMNPVLNYMNEKHGENWWVQFRKK